MLPAPLALNPSLPKEPDTTPPFYNILLGPLSQSTFYPPRYTSTDHLIEYMECLSVAIVPAWMA
jgi:hypothetical protein